MRFSGPWPLKRAWMLSLSEANSLACSMPSARDFPVARAPLVAQRPLATLEAIAGDVLTSAISSRYLAAVGQGILFPLCRSVDALSHSCNKVFSLHGVIREQSRIERSDKLRQSWGIGGHQVYFLEPSGLQISQYLT